MRDNSPCYKLGRSVGGDPVPMDNLRLEISADRFYVLSYHHVELAKFESAQGADIITISFLNRTVCIKGKNLRNLGIALQARNVEWLAGTQPPQLPSGGKAHQNEGETYIRCWFRDEAEALS